MVKQKQQYSNHSQTRPSNFGTLVTRTSILKVVLYQEPNIIQPRFRMKRHAMFGKAQSNKRGGNVRFAPNRPPAGAGAVLAAPNNDPEVEAPNGEAEVAAAAPKSGARAGFVVVEPNKGAAVVAVLGAPNSGADVVAVEPKSDIGFETAGAAPNRGAEVVAVEPKSGAEEVGAVPNNGLLAVELKGLEYELKSII